MHTWQDTGLDAATRARALLAELTLDEKVAQLHLAKLGAKLSKLTAEQADYIGVKSGGPFKSAMYRY